ncbi:integrase core domain-containing protein [Pantoea piersonii]
MLEHLAYVYDIKLRLIQLDKPTRNGFIESFNGRFCDEILSEH